MLSYKAVLNKIMNICVLQSKQDREIGVLLPYTAQIIMLMLSNVIPTDKESITVLTSETHVSFSYIFLIKAVGY